MAPDDALDLDLFPLWYDEKSILVADNWDSTREAVDVEARGTKQIAPPVPKTKGAAKAQQRT